MNGKKKLNVVFFPAWFPTKRNRLGGKFVLEHAKVLQHSANITIVYIDANSELNSLYSFSPEKIEHFEVSILSFKKFNSRWLWPINYILYFSAIGYLFFKEQKKYRESDINHVHVLTRTAVLPYFLKLFYGTPYVISEHWSRYLPEDNTYGGFFRELATKFLVRKSSGISTVSEALKQALAKYGLSHKNSPIISNALDTNKYLPARLEKNDTFLILHVSGLNDEIKNVTGILRAAKMLVEEKYDFELVIIGDDEIEGPIIRKYATELGLTNVKFTGKLYGNDLLAYYQKADVFVLNSNFETQGNVILEAMSCGLPVIATNVGGVKEIMTSDAGILIDARDDKMLAQSMAKVINGEMVFDGGKIRNYVVTNYGYDSVATLILNFYKIAMAK